MQQLEKKDYISRVSVAKDARLKKLILTKKGMEVQQTVDNKICEIERKLSQSISEQEAEQLLEISKKLIQIMHD